jgi:murein L,D-transpeptidase YafK
MPRLIRLTLAAAVLALGVVGYTKAMARIGSGTPPPMAAPQDQADAVLVLKATRELHLLRDGAVIRRYDIVLGPNPEGHKQQEGDGRTPEGTYVIDWRNADSIAHLSLHISYPNDADSARAAAAGVDPGGFIMIHGLPNGWGFLGGIHTAFDWTDGCIGVTNAQMREIWSLVPDGTLITLLAEAP